MGFNRGKKYNQNKIIQFEIANYNYHSRRLRRHLLPKYHPVTSNHAQFQRLEKRININFKFEVIYQERVNLILQYIEGNEQIDHRKNIHSSRE